ncbi:MAG: LssY C-terminal domain-containing protein [Verrucomicrobiaceae bacterium]|nr:LssY C-terminal domain-containing protein [Verrucomicrobiaceae bacterium]
MWLSPKIVLKTVTLLAAMALASCAFRSGHVGDATTPFSQLEHLLGQGNDEVAARMQSKTLDGVTVTAAILPDDEAQKRYGVNLASKGIQAVWMRIENRTRTEQWMLAAHLDADYYTANEAAYLFRHHLGGIGHAARQQKFRDLAMRARLEPGSTHEGHVLVPRSEGGRFVEITTNGLGRERRFGFPLRTPDGHFDFERMKPGSIYAEGERENLSRSQLRQHLAQLAPTVTNAKGTAKGDPLNLVIVGEASEMMAALSECGWDFTHRIDGSTVRRMILAALRGNPYLTAPVSSLYVFGRKQDVAFQRARSSLSQRNHLRLWLAPWMVEGRSVWVGQVSRDIGIKITKKSPTLTTHVIDPMVDEARQYVLESLLERLHISHFGFARAAEPAPKETPRRNLTGDPYFTDGLRLVVFLSEEAVETEKVRNLGWDQTTWGPVEYGQSEAKRASMPPR